MPIYRSSKRHPLESIIYLVLLVITGALIFTAIAVVLASYIFGIPIASLQNSNHINSTNFLKVVQILSSIGTFILPAIVFARIEANEAASYLKLKKAVTPVLYLIAILIVFTSFPVLEYTILLNKQMQLPAFLNELEEWMRSKEEQMAQLTRQLLYMKTPAGLAVNLLMIAVLPAIGEELIFRGCLQQVILRWAKNYHVAVWITAFIFSAIHFQFYGFFPRMLLGALLGYLFIWGKSIWLPILAHFTNNFVSVIAAYIYQVKGESLNKLDEVQYQGWIIYVVSLVLSTILLWLFYRTAITRKQQADLLM